MNYPKVLIYGMSFTPSGGGITLSGLFRKWPMDSIALVNDLFIHEDTSICSRYYQMGQAFQKPEAIGYLPSYGKSGKVGKSRYLARYIGKGLLYLHQLKKKPSLIDDHFMHWVRAFNPDIIYAMVHSIHQIPIIFEMMDVIQRPLVIHMVDDWVQLYNSGFLSFLVKKTLNTEITKLVQKSQLCMAISSEMCIEYQRRYHREFFPLHNSVELRSFPSTRGKPWNKHELFQIVFSGTLESYNVSEVLDLCKAVSGLNVEFHIYGKARDDKYIKEIQKYPCCFYHGYIPHAIVIKSYSEAHLLFLPMTFNKRLLRNVKLSMPTKISEYMLSMTPILLYAHHNTALVRYAESAGWAFIIKRKQVNKLREVVMQLMDNELLRQQMSVKARSIGEQNHTLEVNHAVFLSYLNGVI